MEVPPRIQKYARAILELKDAKWSFARYALKMRLEYVICLCIPITILAVTFGSEAPTGKALALGMVLGFGIRELRAAKAARLGGQLMRLFMDWNKVREFAEGKKESEPTE